MKPLVIYHASCTDGYAAAFAAWMKFGDDAEYLPMHYTPEPAAFNILGRDVYILDFSFPRVTMEYIFSCAKRVVWLDHHRTAAQTFLEMRPDMQRVDGVLPAGFHFETYPIAPCTHKTIINDNKSGAMLAWEYFHPNTEVPLLIQHIDDRDRWQFKMEGSREIHAALSSYKPWSFEQWREWWRDFTPAQGGSTTAFNTFKAQGAAILRAQDQHVESMAKQARKCGIPPTVKIAGCYAPGTVFEPLLGLAVNASLHQSEVGDELANQSGTFGLVWYVAKDNRVRCSLRSNGDYDVSTIAKSFGGGGHRNAAGFETDIQTLMGWLK